MAEILVLVIISVLGILGLAESIHMLRLCIYSPKKKALTYLVINLNANDAEMQLRFVGEQYLWLGKKLADNVIAINDLLDGELKENCRKIAEKYNIIFCSGSELCKDAQMIFGKGI